MTLGTTPPLFDYLEDGLTLVHAIPFQFQLPGDIQCSRISGGVETLLTQGADFTVAGGAGSTGTVTKTSGGVALTIFRIKRMTTRAQTTDYTPGDAFPAEVHEAALDHAAAVDQEQDVSVNDLIARSLRVPPGEIAPELPAKAARIAKYLVGDINGNMVPSAGTGADAGLRTDLAAATGYTLVGGVVHLLAPQGAGGGFVDASPKVQALFDAGHKTVVAPYDNYRFATKLTFPANGALISFEKAVITKGANIDLFDMSAQGCRLVGLNIQGAGATYTGRGAYINAGASSYDQKIIDCDLLDFAGPCLEFVGSDAGQRFEGRGSNFLRTVADNAAIKMPAVTDATGGNRTFTDCGTIGGGRLFDLDSAANTGIVNCQMVSLTFSANTSRTRMTGCRIAAGGGTVTVDGYDNNVVGNVIAGNVQLAATSQRCIVGPNNLIDGGIVTDLSTAIGNDMNLIYDFNGLSLVPLWGQVSGVGPTIGNGTITARLYRNGRQHNLMISLSLGSTSTLGDGTNDWTFALPAPYNRTAVFVSVGKATGNHAGSFVSGDAIIAQGTSVITVRNPGGATGWKAAVPVAWASTSGFNIAIPYEAG